ncbi:MAG: chorismate-binding protein [Cyclobacteriaceae bacterium]|nr:chorismate-binding protein [Cyclobacteriaceae bacterium]
MNDSAGVVSAGSIAAHTETRIISGLIGNALQRGNSFCLWKTPALDEKYLLITREIVLENEISLENAAPGFAFAPFDPSAQKIIFPAETLYRFENGELVEGKLPNAEINPATQKDYHFKATGQTLPVNYEELVNQSISQIASGAFEKVVPSRFEDSAYDKTVDLVAMFERLCEKHPQAFVSFISSPQTGTWMGATPELLVRVSRNRFKTIALAGTLPYSPDTNLKTVAWTQKEIEEQALVSRYIISCFKKIRLREYEEHGPKTIVAGNVLHLKTEFEVDMQATNFPQLGSVMLKLLHPTSAVCGMPLESALEFLQNHEGYPREFYSGYLGPLNIRNQSQLYVNLRCMQFFANQVRFYAGAGVTIDSVPGDEWNETEIKMHNLKKLFY